ncbi:hypothetical protein [Ferrimonas marina]|uniref:Uncharacterized protein n=1 Tax=Ferrimonas marina TaxID=299255 RepID=A0A1M5RC50_9GAMM|nr:hypothetical protein [Ferrimonas marina]SHH23710.1 hypothetical protein SAMN02745129_1560 [Ferrimonas marina]
MKPYKNIKSENLGLLLLLARVTAVFGIFLSFLTLILFIVNALSSGPLAITTSVVYIPVCITTLFLSGLMAATVAIEENYRVRTVHLVSQGKT